MGKSVKKSRHIRWNWEKSPDNDERVRYHIIVVDDKDREGKFRKLIDRVKGQVASNYSFEEIRSAEGKVTGTEFRYLFKSYDTLYSMQFLRNALFDFKAVQDPNLRERKVGNIEDYVANIYE